MAVHDKEESEEKRGWGNLNSDLLISIFRKLDFEDLVVGVPLVCHSWLEGSKNPQCWETLDLKDWKRIMLRFKPKSKFIEVRLFLECAIRCNGGGSIHSIMFPHLVVCESDFLLVAERCPNLKFFHLRLSVMISKPAFCAAISKWKDLEGMDVDKHALHYEILEQINKSCPNFTHLRAHNKVYAAHAYDIVRCLPKLKSLDLSNSVFSYESLLFILRGCKELESLDISGSGGLGLDPEVQKAAAQLKIFRYDHGPFDKEPTWFCPDYADDDYYEF